jgi:hypothetical protein
MVTFFFFPFSFFLFLLSHVFQPTFVGAVSTAKNTALFFGTEVPPTLIRLNRSPLSFIPPLSANLCRSGFNREEHSTFLRD